MGKLSYLAKKRLPRSAFAIPEKRAYPIDTKDRAIAALSRVSRWGTSAEKRRVRAAVKRRYPDIAVSA